MARRELTQAEIEAFRVKVVEAAAVLFAEGGSEAVSMRAIANAIGCSPMTTYRYFADREDVIEALRANAFSAFADAQEAAAAGRTGSSADRLDAIREDYIRFALERADSYRLMFSLQTTRPPGEEFRREAARAFETLHVTVTEGVEDGYIEGDPSTVAHLVWVELHGMVSLQLSQKLNFGRTLDELAQASPWRLGGRRR